MNIANLVEVEKILSDLGPPPAYSLLEYLQCEKILEWKADLSQGKPLRRIYQLRMVIENEWIRSPRFKKLATLLLQLNSSIPSDEEESADDSDPLIFCKPISEREREIFQIHLEKIDGIILKFKNLHPKARFIDSLEEYLRMHRDRLRHFELPESFPEDLIFEPHIGDFDSAGEDLHQSLSEYQSFLFSFEDNVKLKLNPSGTQKSIVVSPQDVTSAIDQAYVEFGQTMKVPGFKRGEAPLDELKKLKTKVFVREAVRDSLSKRMAQNLLFNEGFQEGEFLILSYHPRSQLKENQTYKFDFFFRSLKDL